REFDTELLVAAGNVDEERVYDALEQAEQARLLLPVRTRPGRYTFAHALVRSTLYEEISTTRRLRLHRRVGQALEGRGADRLVDDDLIAVLEEALEMLPPGDSAARAMAMARLGSELYFRTDALERRMPLTEEAVAMARRVGDLPALAFVLNCARFGIWVPGNV